MYTINIDFEVYKAITARRATEDVTDNDVLRQTFGLPPRLNINNRETGVEQHTALENKKTIASIHKEAHVLGWTIKGIHFPIGTEFRAQYRGKMYIGNVEAGGLRVNENVYGSPSAAADAITGTSVNGWIFWECRFPGTSTWKIIKSLRDQK
jgi:hypothetical protein